MRLAGRRRLLFGLVVALLGVAALAVSFVLTPTPNTSTVLSNGHRVPVAADMHAVDYAILFLRIGGAVAVLAVVLCGRTPLEIASRLRSGRPSRLRAQRPRGMGRGHDTVSGDAPLLRRNIGV